jgi:hypothetical protein
MFFGVGFKRQADVATNCLTETSGSQAWSINSTPQWFQELPFNGFVYPELIWADMVYFTWSLKML